MIVNYVYTHDNAVKSLLAFDRLSARWRRALVYRSVIISIFVLFFLLYRTYISNYGIRINGTFYSIASLVVNFVWSAPVSALLGWVTYKFSLITRNNAIIAQFEGLPSDYFGPTSVSLNPDGLTVDAPGFRAQYNWEIINAIKVSEGYLFFLFDSHLVASIPISALGIQQSEFITKAEELMNGINHPPLMEARP